MEKAGKYGEFGGQFIPETVMNAVKELEAAYEKYKNDPSFRRSLRSFTKTTRADPQCCITPRK